MCTCARVCVNVSEGRGMIFRRAHNAFRMLCLLMGFYLHCDMLVIVFAACCAEILFIFVVFFVCCCSRSPLVFFLYAIAPARLDTHTRTNTPALYSGFFDIPRIWRNIVFPRRKYMLLTIFVTNTRTRFYYRLLVSLPLSLLLVPHLQ